MRPVTALAALFGLIFAAGDVAAQSAQQFDLVCTGTRQVGSEAAAVPHDYRIRVDLGVSRWCWDTCEQTYAVAEVAPDRIVFSQERTDTPRRRSTAENAISRVTGEHRLISIQSRPLPMFVETKGHCEAAAFSGFPAARF